MSKFKEGDQVKAVYFDNEGNGYIVGQNCESITVSMEYGQMAEVPWFVVRDSELIEKLNGALLAAVRIK